MTAHSAVQSLDLITNAQQPRCSDVGLSGARFGMMTVEKPISITRVRSPLRSNTSAPANRLVMLRNLDAPPSELSRTRNDRTFWSEMYERYNHTIMSRGNHVRILESNSNVFPASLADSFIWSLPLAQPRVCTSSFPDPYSLPQSTPLRLSLIHVF